MVYLVWESADEMSSDERLPDKKLVFMQRPPITAEGDVDEDALEQWATDVAELLWPQVEAARRRAGERSDT